MKKAKQEKHCPAIRIGIIGAAGTGKTTLAKRISEELGVEFLEAKQITQPILDRDEYDYGSGIQVERFLSSAARQKQILRSTLRQQSNAASWVTDRTFVDIAAYAVCGLHDSDPAVLRRMVEQCREALNGDLYSHLFLCPWIDTPVKDNHKRTLNPWFQCMIHATEVGLMTDWDVSFRWLAATSLVARTREVLQCIRNV